MKNPQNPKCQCVYRWKMFLCTILARLTRQRLPKENLRCSPYLKYPLYHTIFYQVEEGDLLTLLNVYYAFHNRGGSDWSKAKHWCAGHFLRYKALKRFELSMYYVHEL